MSQRMKGSYEDNERYLRNAERVNVNTPVKPGTEQQETDIFGGKPGNDNGDTVILEEKPKQEGPPTSSAPPMKKAKPSTSP